MGFLLYVNNRAGKFRFFTLVLWLKSDGFVCLICLQ